MHCRGDDGEVRMRLGDGFHSAGRAHQPAEFCFRAFEEITQRCVSADLLLLALMEKHAKSAVLYFKPQSINRAGGARCGACWKFVSDPRECLEVNGDISPGGVCGLYVNGVPHPSRLEHTWRITKVSKEEAGYIERGDSHCVGCKNMANPGEPSSPCREVEGLVEQRGCCTSEYVKR